MSSSRSSPGDPRAGPEVAWQALKIGYEDLAGQLAGGMAINETAGYLGVAVTALATGYLATGFGLRPAPSLDAAILVATILTAASGLLAWAVMDETHPGPHAGRGPPP